MTWTQEGSTLVCNLCGQGYPMYDVAHHYDYCPALDEGWETP